MITATKALEMENRVNPPSGLLRDLRVGFVGAGASLLIRRSSVQRVREGSGVAGQKEILFGLTERMAGTAQGRDFGIERGMNYKTFCARVPVRPYEAFVPYVERMKRGEANVLWPGRCDNFAVSSGTTAGRTKYIPVTTAMLDHFRKSGLDSLLYYAARTGRRDVFAGRHLFLGGSTALSPIDGSKFAKAGDLSGITAQDMPFWVKALLYEPGEAIAQIPDWPRKLEAIVRRTLRRDITLIAGIPSWVLILARELRELAGREGSPVCHLGELWPNLQCLIHGGVPIGPFVGELRSALGPEVNFHEVYPASEGFIAAQDDEAAAGLRLMTAAGVFYEFVPMGCFDAADPRASGAYAVPLEGVKAGVDYVLLMTTPAGLCRYVIGDVVRFVSTEVPRLVYAGRTSLQLSAFGEHVIEKDLTDSLVAVGRKLRVAAADFHVAPVFANTELGRDRGRHEWWIELSTSGSAPDPIKLAVALDEELMIRNDDYEAKRKGTGLEVPIVRIAPAGVFEQWKKNNGRWGGQNKMPRCRSDRLIADALAVLAGS